MANTTIVYHPQTRNNADERLTIERQQRRFEIHATRDLNQVLGINKMTNDLIQCYNSKTKHDDTDRRNVKQALMFCRSVLSQDTSVDHKHLVFDILTSLDFYYEDWEYLIRKGTLLEYMIRLSRSHDDNMSLRNKAVCLLIKLCTYNEHFYEQEKRRIDKIIENTLISLNKRVSGSNHLHEFTYNAILLFFKLVSSQSGFNTKVDITSCCISRLIHMVLNYASGYGALREKPLFIACLCIRYDLDLEGKGMGQFFLHELKKCYSGCNDITRDELVPCVDMLVKCIPNSLILNYIEYYLQRQEHSEMLKYLHVADFLFEYSLLFRQSVKLNDDFMAFLNSEAQRQDGNIEAKSIAAKMLNDDMILA